MNNIKTTFTNSTSNPNLKNPFETVPLSDYDSFPSYLKALFTEVFFHHPSIKTKMKVTIDGDRIDITIAMKD